MEKLEILFCEPVYKDYIWGGNKLKGEFNKNTPFEKTAESWEIASNKNGETIIKNGIYKGESLTDLFNNHSIKNYIFGNKCEKLDQFPLLIKFIDANSNLSVQVHPDDKYAQEKENDIGKTEMWYIMDCKQDAKLICGLKNINEENISEELREKNIEKYLNYVSIEKGDVIYIPAGTVHAIMEGALICEIQQNSDLTYRLYDWNRVGNDGKPRQLHLDKAIDVINANNIEMPRATNNEGYERIVDSKYFKVDKAVIRKCLKLETKKDTFYALNVISGNGKIITDKEYDIKLGDSFIIPAYLGNFSLDGNMEVLISYI